jgi:hypothetical protein
VKTTGQTEGLGFIHRKLTGVDIYFVANTGNRPIEGSIQFRSAFSSVEAWNPDGDLLLQSAEGKSLPFALAPYESRVFFLHDGSAAYADQVSEILPPSAKTVEKELADLSTGWKVSFADNSAPQAISNLASWTELPGKQFYSGEAKYSRSFTVDSSRALSPGSTIYLDFGVGNPITDKRPPNAPGVSALLDPPIREAAVVFVNGKRVGSLWHPPYTIGISQYVHPGENKIEVHVYNTAINMLAGQPARDYSALRAKYGHRFDPQDMDNLQPIPSGLLGPIHLKEQRSK